jgi:hypothetical protein
MRVVRNIILFLITLYVAFVAFMPKEQLYFYLEKELNKNGIVIYNERFKETPLSLVVSNGVVSYQGVDVARFSKLEAKIYLLFNQVELENVELLDLAKKALDVELEKLKASYIISKPFLVTIDAKGSFGTAKGYIDLKKKILHIDIVDVQNIIALKKFLRKGEKGWYYEQKF